MSNKVFKTHKIIQKGLLIISFLFLNFFTNPTSASANAYWHNGVGNLDDVGSWYINSALQSPANTVPTAGDVGYINGGTTLTQTGSVSIDYTLNIENGGIINTSNIGTITIADGGVINIENQGTMTVDDGGILNILNGGTLNINSGATFTQSNTSWSIAGNANVYNSQTITSGYTWTVTSGAILTIQDGGNFTVANGGGLTIQDGGTLNINSSATFTQNNASWNIDGVINISNSQSISSSKTWTVAGTGSLNVINGATLTTDSGGALSVNSGGTSNVNSGGIMNINSGGIVNINSGGILNINSGGILNINDGATFTQNNSSWNIGGVVNVSNNQSISSSKVWTVASGGSLSLDNGGIFTINTGGNLTIDSNGTLGIGSLGVFNNNGTMSNNGSAINNGTWRNFGTVVTGASATTTNNVSTAYELTGTVGSPVSTYTLSSQTGHVTTNYNVVLSHSPNSWSATGLPAGLSINSSSGAITGTPTISGNGSTTVVSINISSGSFAIQVINYNFVIAPSGGSSTVIPGGQTGGGSSSIGDTRIIFDNKSPLNNTQDCTKGQKFNTKTGQPCITVGSTNSTADTVATPKGIVVSIDDFNNTALSQGFRFTSNYAIMDINMDIVNLQVFLNRVGFPVTTSGYGSQGLENKRFGPATQAALIKFQKDKGIKPAVGYLGPITRNKINEILMSIGF